MNYLIYQEDGNVDVEYASSLCNMFYLSTGFPMEFYTGASSQPANQYLIDSVDKIALSSIHDGNVNIPISSLLKFNELIISYTLFHKSEYKGIFFIGPMRVEDITSEYLNQVVQLYPDHDVVSIKLQLESMPYCNPSQIVSLKYLLSVVVSSEVNFKNTSPRYGTNSKSIEPSSFKIPKDIKHHSYLKVDQFIIDSIESDKSFEEMVANYFGDVAMPTLSKNDILRSEKNRLIISSSLYCRSAISRGVPYETSFSYADFFVRRVEEISSLSQVTTVFWDMILFYRTEVKKAKEKRCYNSQTREIVNYIESHITDSLNLKTISDILCFNYKYVSKLFHKDTGYTFNDFVYEKKVNIAKDLLKNPRYKISDISHYLGFNEPYYFNRIFKHYTGFTPGGYRNIAGR